MFNEKLKELRKAKYISQEELAKQLHVVRQTISKWEKGLSVPDADILIKLADILEVSVSELLGQKVDSESNSNDVAEQLARINEQLDAKNRRAKRIWKIIAIIIISIVAFNIIMTILSLVSFGMYSTEIEVEYEYSDIVQQ